MTIAIDYDATPNQCGIYFRQQENWASITRHKLIFRSFNNANFIRPLRQFWVHTQFERITKFAYATIAGFRWRCTVGAAIKLLRAI